MLLFPHLANLECLILYQSRTCVFIYYFICSTAVPLPDFDAVKPLQKLDSRAALHKSQVGGQIKRKKPSRDHLRQMGSSSNLLEVISSDSSLTEEPSSPATENETSNKAEKEEKDKKKETEKDKHPAPPTEQTTPTVAPTPPKPKPRAAPRKKNPELTSTNVDGSKPHPQVVPRHKLDGKELSPLHESGKSGKEEVNDKEESHPTTAGDLTSSPSTQRKEGLLASPVMASKTSHSSPKRPPPSPKNELSHSGDSEEHAPKPLPRGHGKTGKEEEASSSKDAKMAELLKKDPSELTVKEKALLAQRTVVAMSHVDKTKLPPPIPRKPKPGHGGEGDTLAVNSEIERGRSHSIDEKETKASPSHGRRKLPPGAVNIMAGLALSSERGRCNTVSTTEPDARERDSLGRNATLQDHPPENGVDSSSHEALEQTDHDSPTKPLPKTPPKRPPLPMQKKPSNEKPLTTEGVDTESDTSPPLARRGVDTEDDEEHEAPRQSHDGGEQAVDLNTILTWTPDVVGQWLNNIGLGQYKELFVGVQGFMLFDMDGHRLKVSE